MSDIYCLERITRIVFVGHDNEGSSRLFDVIASRFPKCEFLLVEAQGLYYKKSFFSSVIKLIKEASWIFVILRFFELMKYKLFGVNLRQVAKNHSVPIIRTNDINSETTVSEIKAFAPDLLVSLFTMQIFKNEVINLPKFGSITSHPSILPAYRGLEVFFWVLANNEKETGVSVFFLSERIDEGRVIWQKRIKIDKSTTVASLYKEITEIGSRGLVESIVAIDHNSVSEVPQVGSGSYFPMPNSAAVRRFFKLGRKFY